MTKYILIFVLLIGCKKQPINKNGYGVAFTVTNPASTPKLILSLDSITNVLAIGGGPNDNGTATPSMIVGKGISVTSNWESIPNHMVSITGVLPIAECGNGTSRPINIISGTNITLTDGIWVKYSNDNTDIKGPLITGNNLMYMR